MYQKLKIALKRDLSGKRLQSSHPEGVVNYITQL